MPCLLALQLLLLSGGCVEAAQPKVEADAAAADTTPEKSAGSANSTTGTTSEQAPAEDLPHLSLDPQQELSRILFGSCAKQNQPQPIWQAILGRKPQVFLFIGDNIYGDTQDMQELQQKWNLLGAQPGYRNLLETCPVLATWDDHDYGADDAGRNYPKREESQRVFLDFFGEPQDTARRKTPGVYDAKLVGPPGKQVQLILLDTRYFRDDLVPGPPDVEPGEGISGRYRPNPDEEATILGEAQWNWLRQQLKQPVQLRVIASSIQVLADGHGWESWSRFPHERQRLLDAIDSSAAGANVIISGDRHQAEISQVTTASGRVVCDVTSSSLNAPGRWRNELNPHRLGVIYYATNFGVIEVDWAADDPVVRLQVCGEDGKVKLQHRLPLSGFEPR
ncbi:MAG: alkaline phosphatase family protein [Planctomycetaceae bacterium]|nr:alkaline phosphatase family protein [Planctomycetaceae bacterium]